MIIYGSRATHLKSAQLPNESWPNCNTKGTIVMSVFGRYAHIFWLPTFPLGRKGGSQCANCKQVLESKQMPQSLRSQYDQLAAQTRVPIWSWTGLAAIVALIGFASYGAGVDKDNEKKYLAAPVAGDVYSVKLNEGNYSLMKVALVTPDSLMMNLSSYTVDKMSGMYKLKSKEYDTLGYWISREKIKEMYEKKDIFDIDR